MSAGLSRRALLGAAGGLAGAAAGGPGGLGALERALAASERRNVVLIVIDSLRADHLRCYGASEMHTPSLDALARESTRFTRVYPEAMPTVPARRAIYTGRRTYPFRGWRPWDGMAPRPGWEPIKPGAETLVTALRRAGWWTAVVTDNPFLGYTRTFEPFRRAPHRFVRVEGQRGTRHPHARDVPRAAALKRLPPGALRDERRIETIRRYLANNGRGRVEHQEAAARVFRAAGDALAQARRRSRFLLVVDCFDPHEPWTPARRYLDMYGDPDYDGSEIADVRYTHASAYLERHHLARLRVTYKASVTTVDRWLGRFLERLHDLRLDDSTAIALVSDHGVYLGERNWTGKCDRLLHPELIHVPLLVREPGGAGAGATSDWLASTHDVAPTLLALAGARRPNEFEGRDLTPILEGREPRGPGRGYAVGGYGNYSYCRDGRWAYMVRNDGADERLYDLVADPGERRDVKRRNPDVLRRMRARVRRRAKGEPPFYPERVLDGPRRDSFGRPAPKAGGQLRTARS